jgi:hypothetical protein
LQALHFFYFFTRRKLAGTLPGLGSIVRFTSQQIERGSQDQLDLAQSAIDGYESKTWLRTFSKVPLKSPWSPGPRELSRGSSKRTVECFLRRAGFPRARPIPRTAARAAIERIQLRIGPLADVAGQRCGCDPLAAPNAACTVGQKLVVCGPLGGLPVGLLSGLLQPICERLVVFDNSRPGVFGGFGLRHTPLFGGDLVRGLQRLRQALRVSVRRCWL